MLKFVRLARVAHTMDREAKLRKLNEFRCSMPHVSSTALSSLLARARAGDLPELSSRNDIRDARDANVLQSTPYGNLIERTDLACFPEGTITVEMANPVANLYIAAKTKFFAQMLQNTFATRPCSLERPWKLCLYADEAKPGAQMKQDNKRVLQNVYWSFLDFGAAALSKEDFWFVACTIRSNEVNKVASKMSQVIAKVIKRFFTSAMHNMRYGVHCELPDSTMLKIYCEFSCMLADESALHGLWYCKGSSGIKCCLQCMHIVNKNWDGAEYLLPEDNLKTWSQVVDARELTLHSKDSIMDIIHQLQIAKEVLGVGDFKAKETRLGWKYNSHSVLSDVESRNLVDPAEHNTYDWSHNLCQGIFQIVLWLVLEQLAPYNFKFTMIHEYLQRWSWPRRLDAKNACGKDLFSPKRTASHRAAKLIKAQISEVLSVHHVIAHWIRACVMPSKIASDACRVYLLLSTLISMLWYCAKLSISSDDIAEATTLFLQAFKDTFGEDEMTWKFHAILHHARSVFKFGWSPHTITMERKHKTILNLARDLHNAKAMDNVLREVLNKQLNALQHGSWLDLSIGLLNATKPNSKLLAWMNSALGEVVHTTSAAARISEYDTCHKGDIIAVRQESHADWFAARVLFFGCSSDISYAAISPFSLVEKHATFSKWTDANDDPIVVYLNEIVDSLVHSSIDNSLVVLHPLALHGL